MSKRTKRSLTSEPSSRIVCDLPQCEKSNNGHEKAENNRDCDVGSQGHLWDWGSTVDVIGGG